jgi:hypothetical protein
MKPRVSIGGKRWRGACALKFCRLEFFVSFCFQDKKKRSKFETE